MSLLFVPLMIGTTEIVLLAAAALLIFGGKKLPQMMRNMGKGVKEFKEGIQGAPENFQEGMNEGKSPEQKPEPKEMVNPSESREDVSIDGK